MFRPRAGANITSIYIMFNIDNRFSRKHPAGEDWPYRYTEPQWAACRPSRPQGLRGLRCLQGSVSDGSKSTPTDAQGRKEIFA